MTGHALRHFQLSTRGLGFAALAAGLATALVFGSGRAAEGSLPDLEIEHNELKLTLEKIAGENRQLREALLKDETTLAEMRRNLAASNGEGEIFRRQALDLKLRIEALGLDFSSAGGSKLEQRLLTAVSDLRVISEEKKKLAEALVRLSEAASIFARAPAEASTESRSMLEAELRNARAALGAGSPTAVEATAVPPTMTDAMAISVRDDLALVVMNLGSKQGVRVGMPFQVIRAGKEIGSVRVVDVREKIAGAVVQSLSSEKDQVKVGDHLKVAAQQ